METESVAKRAIALITERGAMRSDQIAEALGVAGKVVSASLAGHVDNGALVACRVERPGTAVSVNEYRISAGGKTAGFREYKPRDTGKKTPPQPVPAEAATEATAKPKLAYKRRAPVRKVQKPVLSAKRPRVARKAAKTVRKPHKTVRATHFPAAIGSFRAAIASDGAMIFLGAAAGGFELTRPESRALIDFVRTLDRGEVGASPQGGPR